MKEVQIVYRKFHNTGNVTEKAILKRFGFFGAVWQLWCFFRHRGSQLDDFDQMTITFL